jgi:hypothetical protein
MEPLEWIPEPYSKLGGLAADGFAKLLGRPKLDPLTVLVRETAQNSWDARLPNQAVRFEIEGWDGIYADELETLKSVVFPGIKQTKTDAKKVLSRKGMSALYILDRGTRGLGGPTLADEVSQSQVYDWVDFVLNVGKQNTEAQTGGTYGFGKTITYIVSAASAIVIHSRTMHRGRIESRLIACAIGKEFERNGRLHTGRHWWGVAEGGAAKPATGRHADEIADAVGMPSFGVGETGTNIMVLEPDFGDRTPEQAMNFIAESVTWHLWPKMHSRDDSGWSPPMNIRISFNDLDVPVPSPDDRPPLHGFVQAFTALLEGVPEGRREDGLERRAIEILRPQVTSGDIVTVPLVARPRAAVDDGSDPSDNEAPPPAAAITGACHHVALLRSPELVVDYLPGPAPNEGGTEWAAVFRCRPEVDEFFSSAEPPTHDSWQPELLAKSKGKTIVKVSLERIRAFVQERWGVATRPDPSPSPTSTSLIADELASLVRGQPGLGPGRGPTRERSNFGGPKAQGPGADVISTGVALLDGEPVTVATIRVEPRLGDQSTTIHVRVGVALEGGGTTTDIDSALSLVSAITGDSIQQLDGHNATIEVQGAGVSEVTVSASRGLDTVVEFDATAEAPE